MVNPRPSKICILLLSLFLLVVPSLQVTNHTDNILDIHKFLDFIETRINYAIESKTNDITTAKSQLAQEHEVKTTNLEEMHDDYIASKATAIAKYEAAQEAADHEFQQAMAAVKDKEHQLNTTKDALHNFEAYIDSEHDRMDQNLAKFIQNMEAELQLVVEIRTILDALHSRSVKGVLEHCDEQYSCRGSLQCVESVCLAPPKESCEQSNECTPGSICHHSQCLKSIGQSCSRHEDCSTARCDSSQGKCHGILDSLEMHLALNPFMPSNRPLQSATLCYKGTIHGFSSSTFHSRCDNRGPSVSVMRTTENFVFGGYNSNSWTTSSSYRSSSENFLFSLRDASGNREPRKMMVSDTSHATYDHSDLCPTFGGGRDLHLDSSCRSGYTYPHSYSLPSREYLAGSYNGWQLNEIEIYYW